MIDLDALRRKVAEKAEPDAIVTVSRRYLEQVEREITEGRVAQAQLARNACMADIIGGIEQRASR